MKKVMRKLQLSKETLRQLEESRLSPVWGGDSAGCGTQNVSCANTCSWQYCPTGGPEVTR